MIGCTVSLAVVFLVTFAVNLIHWRFRVGEQVLYVPTSGILAAVNVAMFLAVLATAILFLSGMVPSTLFLCLGFSYAEATQIFSIWVRHYHRRACAVD